jgi:hypothetical protein
MGICAIIVIWVKGLGGGLNLLRDIVEDASPKLLGHGDTVFILGNGCTLWPCILSCMDLLCDSAGMYSATFKTRQAEGFKDPVSLIRTTASGVWSAE